MKAAIHLLAVLAFTTSASAKIIYVDDDASSGGGGASWDTALEHLQDALATATAGDEIRVAEGIYKPDQGMGKTSGDRSASLVIVGGISLYGGYKGIETTRAILGDPDKTILTGEISTDKANRSLHVLTGKDLDGSTTVDGFRITMGNANDYALGSPKGGGIYLENSFLMFRNCVFAKNSAFYGGGVYLVKSSPTFVRCVFTENSVDGGYGGGFYNESSSPTLLDCVFTGNGAGIGGAMGNYGSSPTLTNCIFANNTALANGGAMENSASSPSLVNCVFTANAAVVGGSLFNHLESSPTLTNGIVWGNTTSETLGHGIAVQAGSSWSNGAVLSESAYVPIIAQGWTGDGRATSANPLFLNPEDPDGPDNQWFTADDGLRLSQGSPAIDAGSDAHLTADKHDIDGDGNLSEATPHDAAGYLRSQDATVDLGPYEYGNIYPGNWSQAKDHGGHWKSFHWFGLYFATSGGWLYHERLGWVYRQGNDPNSFWLWRKDLGWLWTSRAAFPYLWRHEKDGWLYFNKDAFTGKTLYSFVQGKWLNP